MKKQKLRIRIVAEEVTEATVEVKLTSDLIDMFPVHNYPCGTRLEWFKDGAGSYTDAFIAGVDQWHLEPRGHEPGPSIYRFILAHLASGRAILSKYMPRVDQYEVEAERYVPIKYYGKVLEKLIPEAVRNFITIDWKAMEKFFQENPDARPRWMKFEERPVLKLKPEPPPVHYSDPEKKAKDENIMGKILRGEK